MVKVEQKIRLVGPLGEREVTASFDAGTSVSCIHPDIASRLEDCIAIRPPWRITTAQGKTIAEASEVASLEFYLMGYRFMSQFWLVPGLTEEVIVGAATIRQWRSKLDFEREEVIIDPRVTRMRI